MASLACVCALNKSSGRLLGTHYSRRQYSETREKHVWSLLFYLFSTSSASLDKIVFISPYPSQRWCFPNRKLQAENRTSTKAKNNDLRQVTASLVSQVSAPTDSENSNFESSTRVVIIPIVYIMNCVDIKSGSRLEMDKQVASKPAAERDAVTGLSAVDREAIRTSWALVNSNAEANGTALMLRFFQEYPHNLEFFTAFRGLSPEELQKSVGLQQHAMRVMKALTLIVDSIDDSHVLIDVLHKTVDSHLTRGIRVSQFTELFDVFAKTLALTLADQFSSEMSDAWVKTAAAILAVVGARMKEKLAAQPSGTQTPAS